MRWSFLLIPVLAWGGARPAQFHRIYVFGDSYSDIGEGYLDGDGPTAVAYLAERMGTPLAKSTDPDGARKSLDFAVSGAQTGSGAGRRVGDALLGFGMKNQVADFARRVKSHSIQFRPGSTLFYLAGGLNDRNLSSYETVSHLKDEIRSLYTLGARHFAVALLPTAIPAFAAVGTRLNPELARIPQDMMAELRGVEIALSQWGPLFDEVMRNPSKYGITNTTDACAGRAIFHQDATPCKTPAAYYYYHSGHPSTAVHRVVGEGLWRQMRTQ